VDPSGFHDNVGMTAEDWAAWHDDYDSPESELSRRLAIVQGRIRDALDAQPPGPVRILSMCAGQGRDLIGVLDGHPRRDDVRARLVELDPRNVAVAKETAPAGVEVVAGDAALTAAYDGLVPVDIALVCGVFGNVSDDDIRHTVRQLPMLCRPGATVVWTRHVEPPDLTPAIRGWFAESGFEEVAFDTETGAWFGVGTHRFAGEPQPYRPDVRLFKFF
jgi:hypothetical protein